MKTEEVRCAETKSAAADGGHNPSNGNGAEDRTEALERQRCTDTFAAWASASKGWPNAFALDIAAVAWTQAWRASAAYERGATEVLRKEAATPVPLEFLHAGPKPS